MPRLALLPAAVTAMPVGPRWRLSPQREGTYRTPPPATSGLAQARLLSRRLCGPEILCCVLCLLFLVFSRMFGLSSGLTACRPFLFLRYVLKSFFRSFIPSCACACPHYHFRAESPSLSMGSVECRAPPRSRPRRPSRGTVAYPSAPHHTTTLPPTMPHLRALEGVSPGGAPPQRPRRPTPRPPPHAAAPATRWPPGQTPARPP